MPFNFLCFQSSLPFKRFVYHPFFREHTSRRPLCNHSFLCFMLFFKHFSLCLFFSLVDSTHILDLACVVSLAFDHFVSQLTFMGLVVQFCKCSIWGHFGLLFRFAFPTSFCCPIYNINILGIPFSSSSFSSSFL